MRIFLKNLRGCMNCLKDKVSVIIPVYNVEPYIKKCLDSVVNQTYKNLEILLIDDGSTDNSGNICDEYANIDNRIKIFHKKNGGVSSARNLGILNMTGAYVTFTDSDDWLEPDFIEVLASLLKINNATISICNYFSERDFESVLVENKGRIPDGIVSTKNMLLYAMKRDYNLGFCAYPWNKLFSANVIKKSGVLFDESVKYSEDVLFWTQLVIKENCTGVYTNKPLYHYRVRESSATNKKPLGNRTDSFRVYGSVIKLLEDNGFDDVSIWVKRFYCYFAGKYADIALKNGEYEIFKEMQAEIPKYLNEYKATNSEYPERLNWIDGLLRSNVDG